MVTNRSDKPVIAVTGGGQGIGREILMYFAQRGYNVAILDRNENSAQSVAKECEALGAVAIALCCDITKRQQVMDAYEKIEALFGGRLDVQVNNAGVLARGRIEDISEENMDMMIDVNLHGTLNTARAALRLMKEHGGTMINANSILATFPDVGMGVYSATKSAVLTLTRVMAAEFAPYHIRVNAYAPSVTDTPMVHDIIEKRGAQKLDQIPMRKFGIPEHIAKICWFLASDLADYTTGISIASDGGTWTVQRPRLAWEAAEKL